MPKYTRRVETLDELFIKPTIIADNKCAHITIVADQIMAAAIETKKSLRLPLRESSSRSSADFTYAGYGLLHLERHVLG